LFYFKNIFVANTLISPFDRQTRYIKSFLYTTALLCFPKNLIPWRDYNPGLLVPEADAMSTAPRVTRRVLKKIAQNVSQPIFLSKLIQTLSRGKKGRSPKYLPNSVIKKTCPK
jgi:hypothetical protein